MTKSPPVSNYVKGLLTDGESIACDEDGSFELTLPAWVDGKRIKRGQKFFIMNLQAMSLALFCGLMATAAVDSILSVLKHTGKSSTAATAYKRFKANKMHANLWYTKPLVPGSMSWKSLEYIRKIHLQISRASSKAGNGIISQKDMAITQFLFMGLHVNQPYMVGIQGTPEQFSDFCHMWRLIGHLLGIHDRFNVCADTLEETLRRVEGIKAEIIRPALEFPTEGFKSYSKTALDGMWCFEPLLHYETHMFMIKRLVGIPGYHYFQSEAPGVSNQENIARLSLYARARLFWMVICHQYLLQVSAIRYIFFTLKIMFLTFLEKLPLFAIYQFGQKNSYVKILKQYQ